MLDNSNCTSKYARQSSEKGILLENQFKHIDLKLIQPLFDSETTNL